MDGFVVAFLLGMAAFLLRAKEQTQKVALLAGHLSQFQIEKLMEQLTQGYLRALGEDDPDRRAQVWALLSTSEIILTEQFDRFATGFAKEAEAASRVSRLPVAVPLVSQWLPQTTFDLRQVINLHAKAIRAAVNNTQRQPAKGKAFTLSAELFLMQHTCHWFCKSKTIASARLLARHKTSYEQVLAAVAPATRQAYLALVRGPGTAGRHA